MRLMKKLREGQKTNTDEEGDISNLNTLEQNVLLRLPWELNYLVSQKELNRFKCDQCKFILINSDDLMKHQRFTMNRNTTEEETRRTAQFRGRQ